MKQNKDLHEGYAAEDAVRALTRLSEAFAGALESLKTMAGALGRIAGGDLLATEMEVSDERKP